MEEVIFAGTASRKSRGMAEVTLVMDNSTHFLPIDYTEVAITRDVYKRQIICNAGPVKTGSVHNLADPAGLRAVGNLEEGYSRWKRAGNRFRPL